MKKGKFQNGETRHVRGSFRTLSLVLALVLLIGGVVGGTVAWLVAQTDAVVNTFTYGDINITLEETDTTLDGDGNANTNQYKMIPGSELSKDPKVTVVKDSEASWLFVKLVKSEGFDKFMQYEVAEGWTALDGQDGVYYREVDAVTADTEFAVLKGSEKNPNGVVTVKGEVTKADLNALTAYPTLTITAYAVQKENIETAAAAWEIANPTTTP